MAETIQTSELGQRIRKVLDHVRVQRQSVVVYTGDTPHAAIIPYDDYLAYQAWRERQQQRRTWLAELRAIAEEVSARAALSDGEAAALIDEARAS
jgi:PHD/YefM family antitoxin component YafN of YafNO toxin-antitoxin module